MSVSNKLVGANIAHLRTQLGMTQQQLAGVLGVSHQAVSKWETGLAMPDIESLMQMARLFGVTLEQLLQDNLANGDEDEASSECGSCPDSLIDENVVEGLREAAQRVAQTAQGIGSSIFRRVSSIFGGDEQASEGEAERPGAEEEEEPKPAAEESAPQAESSAPSAEETASSDEGASDASQGLSLEALIDLAPFMSREKLSALVEACADPVDVKTLLRLAPFLTQETLSRKLEQLSAEGCSVDTLTSFAPFIRKELLFKLVMANAGQLDLASLKRLAPFLKKGMVDTLVDTISGVKKTVTPDTVMDFADKAVKGAGSLLGKLRDAAVQAVQAVQAQTDPEAEPQDAGNDECPCCEHPCDEACDGCDDSPEDTAAPASEPEAASEPADAEAEQPAESAPEASADRAREALEARNWLWIKQNVYAINDQTLLRDIALVAAEELDDDAAADMLLNLAPYLGSASFTETLLSLCDAGFWGRVCVLAPLCDAEAADEVLKKAVSAGSSASEALRLFSTHATQDCLKSLIRQAIEAENWEVVGILSKAV